MARSTRVESRVRRREEVEGWCIPEDLKDFEKVSCDGRRSDGA